MDQPRREPFFQGKRIVYYEGEVFVNRPPEESHIEVIEAEDENRGVQSRPA